MPYQTSNIRPLGTEHLRMFRRVAGAATEGVFKVALPKEAARIKVFVLLEFLTAENASKFAKMKGGRLATCVEALAFEKWFRNSPVWVSWRGVPREEVWYEIRLGENNVIYPLRPLQTDSEVNKLLPQHRLYVEHSAIVTSKAKGVVELRVGYDHSDRPGLVLDGFYGKNNEAVVAIATGGKKR